MWCSVGSGKRSGRSSMIHLFAWTKTPVSQGRIRRLARSGKKENVQFLDEGAEDDVAAPLDDEKDALFDE